MKQCDEKTAGERIRVPTTLFKNDVAYRGLDKLFIDAFTVCQLWITRKVATIVVFP